MQIVQALLLRQPLIFLFQTIKIIQKDDSKNSSNDTSNKKVSSNTGNSGLINPPIADNMNDYGDANSPSTVVDEAKNEELEKI